jgi:hypothetical protein
MRYADAVALPGRKQGDIVAFFSIASFVAIFVIGIVWATRPAHEGESRFF